MNYALVIGVSDYPNLPSLAGVANDVGGISQILASSDEKSYLLADGSHRPGCQL